jgi:hypothetical protein
MVFMNKILVLTSIFIICLFLCPQFVNAEVVEAKEVDFPIAGKVLVRAVEDIGNVPKLIMTNPKTGEIVFEYENNDPELDLVLRIRDDRMPYLQAFIRFLILTSDKDLSPLILAMIVRPGGSDSSFMSVVIGEVNGKIMLLTPETIDTSAQGGIFVGNLNRRFGFGIVVWNFIWDSGAHYSLHPYEIKLFSFSDSKFEIKLNYITKHKYHGNGVEALREIGIFAHDLREEMEKVMEYAQ